MSTELWEATKNVPCRVFINRKYWVAPEERPSLAALAICDALPKWEPERGDFALACYYYAIKVSDEHRKRFGQCIRLPMHYNTRDFGEITSINPDHFTRDDGEAAGVDYWDNLLQCTQEDESVSEELETVLARMPEKYKKVYRLFYECELRYVDISEVTGMSTTSINDRLKAMRIWVKKELKKDELGRRMGMDGQKGHP